MFSYLCLTYTVHIGYQKLENNLNKSGKLGNCIECINKCHVHN